jgi:hypothetical protein
MLGKKPSSSSSSEAKAGEGNPEEKKQQRKKAAPKQKKPRGEAKSKEAKEPGKKSKSKSTKKELQTTVISNEVMCCLYCVSSQSVMSEEGIIAMLKLLGARPQDQDELQVCECEQCIVTYGVLLLGPD